MNWVFYILSAIIFSASTVQELQAANAYNTKVTQVIVGRNQDEVQFAVSGGNIETNPCGEHPGGIRFGFSLSRPDGEAVLSALLTAFASSAKITIVGTNSCVQQVENISYLWMVK